MKELLTQYAQYNQWANKLIIDTCLKAGDDVVNMEQVSSFSSIRATALHVWSAEHTWLQRLQLVEHPVWMESTFTGAFAEICKEWETTSADVTAFAEKQYDDRGFTHVLQYDDLKKNPHKTPVYQVLHHIFNHSTYHRGQLVTMLRQAGVTEIPRTDFIAFVRIK